MDLLIFLSTRCERPWVRMILWFRGQKHVSLILHLSLLHFLDPFEERLWLGERWLENGSKKTKILLFHHVTVVIDDSLGWVRQLLVTRFSGHDLRDWGIFHGQRNALSLVRFVLPQLPHIVKLRRVKFEPAIAVGDLLRADRLGPRHQSRLPPLNATVPSCIGLDLQRGHRPVRRSMVQVLRKFLVFNRVCRRRGLIRW